MADIVLASASPRALRASMLFCDGITEVSGPITGKPHLVTTLHRSWLAFTDGVSMVLHATTRAEAQAYAEFRDAEVQSRMSKALFGPMKEHAKAKGEVSTAYLLDWVRVGTEGCPVCKGERCIPASRSDVQHLEYHTGYIAGVPFDRRRIDQILATTDLEPSVEVLLAATKAKKDTKPIRVLNLRFSNTNLFTCGLEGDDSDPGPELLEGTKYAKRKAVQRDKSG